MFITILANFTKLRLLTHPTSGLPIVRILFQISQNRIELMKLLLVERMDAVDGYLLVVTSSGLVSQYSHMKSFMIRSMSSVVH